MVFLSVTIVIILLFSALIAALETAITASSFGKIRKLLSNTRSKKKSLILNILNTKNNAISTLLIGNSIANICSTTLATSVFIHVFGKDLGTLISSIIMSFLIVVFAEVVPKTIAVNKPEEIVIRFAVVLNRLLIFFGPVNKILDHIMNIFCRIFNINLISKVSPEDELEGMIKHYIKEGQVSKDDLNMTLATLNMKNIKVSEIMLHRNSVFSIEYNMEKHKIVKILISCPHSRVPVWKNNKNNIVGIIHIKKLFHYIYNKKDSDFKMEELITEPLFIYENVLVIDQLKSFKNSKVHFACIVDEYGEFQGIVTLEDILEEIVGQIYDEYDLEIKQIISQSKTEFIVDGATSIRDINRELGLKIPENKSSTIAGFVINQLSYIPDEGEICMFDNLKFIILNKVNNSIKNLKIEKLLK